MERAAQAEWAQAQGEAWAVPGRTGSSATASATAHQTAVSADITHPSDMHDASKDHDGDGDGNESSDEEAAGQHSDEAHAAKAHGDNDEPRKEELQQEPLKSAATAASAPSPTLSSSVPLRSNAARTAHPRPRSWRASLEATSAPPKSRRATAAYNAIRKRARAPKQNKEAEGAQSASVSAADGKKKSGRFVCPFHCSPKAEFALVSRRTSRDTSSNAHTWMQNAERFSKRRHSRRRENSMVRGSTHEKQQASNGP